MKNKKLLIICVLLLICQFQIDGLSQQSREYPNWIISSNQTDMTPIGFKYQYKTMDNWWYNTEYKEFHQNPTFGLLSRQSYAVPFLGFTCYSLYSTGIFAVPKNEMETSAQAYIVKTEIESEQEPYTRYSFYFQIRLIFSNSTHVGFNLIKGSYYNDGSWTEYVNKIIYVPKADGYYIEMQSHANCFFSSQYRFSLLNLLIIRNENNEIISSYLDYLNGLGLGLSSRYRIYYQEVYNSHPMYPDDTEYSRLLYYEGYFHSIWYDHNTIESYNFYYSNSLFNRLGISLNFEINQVYDKYWGYTSANLTRDYNETIYFYYEYEVSNDSWTEIGNATITKNISIQFNYTMLALNNANLKFYYTENALQKETLGNWNTFNFVRDSFCFILNWSIILLQFILYLLLIALNYLIWYPLAFVIFILNNYVAFGITWGLAGMIFLVAVVGIMIYLYLLKPLIDIIWYNGLVPAGKWIIDEFYKLIEWLKNDGVRLIFEWFLMVIAFVITAILFVLSLGTIDFHYTWSAISNFLIQINSIIFVIGKTFLDNFVLFLGYSGTYITLVCLVYLKYIYAKAKGYTQRATKLQSMINVYKLPMVLVIRISQYIIGWIQGGVPTDGADK